MNAESPLGRKSAYPTHYAPEVLYPIARTDSRRALGIDERELPFRGEDVWTAYDLSWLTPGGKPAAAIATLCVPAASPRLVESKSLKLYLDSLAMTRFGDDQAVAAAIAADLSKACGAPVAVALAPASVPSQPGDERSGFPGACIDDIVVNCDRWQVDPSLLAVAGDETVSETLHSHLLRSLCPVTGQPDIGSILVRYRGPQMDHGALLRYLVSYRAHSDFHENCIERIFLDIKGHCVPSRLSVYGRYNRRGGLDINPFRSDSEDEAPKLRLPRQ
jgi:7-cyano-7-deazaguanine reductase